MEERWPRGPGALTCHSKRKTPWDLPRNRVGVWGSFRGAIAHSGEGAVTQPREMRLGPSRSWFASDLGEMWEGG